MNAPRLAHCSIATALRSGRRRPGRQAGSPTNLKDSKPVRGRRGTKAGQASTRKHAAPATRVSDEEDKPRPNGADPQNGRLRAKPRARPAQGCAWCAESILAMKSAGTARWAVVFSRMRWSRRNWRLTLPPFARPLRQFPASWRPRPADRRSRAPACAPQAFFPCVHAW
jgi:hypothetical protein